VELGGLLLTGGASTRMGRDKATLELRGMTLAARAARALRAVADLVLAVGPESGSGFETVADPREGPLAAVVAGATALHGRGRSGPVLVLACDMPFVPARLLSLVARSLGSADAAVPVAAGRDQPLCAAYQTAAVLEHGVASLERGERSMRGLLDALPSVLRLDEAHWTSVAGAGAFEDLDTPEDLERAAASVRTDADGA
jgi:molybdenum cofactor guanylyltransferase